jgi:hypothetical protein
MTSVTVIVIDPDSETLTPPQFCDALNQPRSSSQIHLTHPCTRTIWHGDVKEVSD